MKSIKFKKKVTILQIVMQFLNPNRGSRKLWTVSSSGWYGGSFESFWKLEDAIRYAKKENDLFVDIENEITGEDIRVRNNPDKVKPPIRYAYV